MPWVSSCKRSIAGSSKWLRTKNRRLGVTQLWTFSNNISLFSGEADSNDCYLEIHAGQGGTEAQDWAEMLARMYSRWAEKKGYKVEYLEESAGEGAGIKSVTFRISGHNAYGWLTTESGSTPPATA